MIAKVLNPHCHGGIQGQSHDIPPRGDAYNHSHTLNDDFIHWIYLMLEDSTNVILISREEFKAQYEMTPKGITELSHETPEGQ